MDIINSTKWQLISNYSFYLVNFGAFMLMRKRILKKNYSSTHISPYCRVILNYQQKNSSYYGAKLLIFCIMSTFTTVTSNFLKAQSDKIINNYEVDFQKEQLHKLYRQYGQNSQKLLNPLFFCAIFGLPLRLGIVAGILFYQVNDKVLEEVRNLVIE